MCQALGSILSTAEKKRKKKVKENGWKEGREKGREERPRKSKQYEIRSPCSPAELDSV